MSKGMNCSYCNAVFPVTNDTVRTRYPSFSNENADSHAERYGMSWDSWEDTGSAIAVQFSLCPNCNKYSINIVGSGLEFDKLSFSIVPLSSARQFPEYIPKSIRNDYEEACKIKSLSPKASATLSRRCLQSMIRDYWQVTNKKNLFEEIKEIEDKVDPQVRKVLDGVRQLGNIGAHMEKDINLIIDIDPQEAEKLIQLIEYLMEQWYIKRNETDDLLKSIIDINNVKQNIRKS